METNWSAQTVNSCLESVQPVLFFVSFVPNFNSERQYFSVTVWYISYTCSDSHFYGRVAGLAEDISHYLISQPGASALRLLNRSCSAVRSTLLFHSNQPGKPQKTSHTLIYGLRHAELRWDSRMEVAICAAAKHRVNNLPDGGLNKRGNKWTQAKTALLGAGRAHSPWLCPRSCGSLVVAIAWQSGRRGDMLAERKSDKRRPAEQML